MDSADSAERKDTKREPISTQSILEEMEYDLLAYLSIPQILSHHHLMAFYEHHPDSKLPHRLRRKYGPRLTTKEDDDEDPVVMTHSVGHSVHSDSVHIEMYFCGMPFVADTLRNVCSV